MDHSDICRIFTSNSIQLMWDFYQKFNSILKKKSPIKKDDYIFLVNEYNDNFEYLKRLEKDNLIKYACNINNISYSEVKYIISLFYNIENVVLKHNLSIEEDAHLNYSIFDDHLNYYKNYSYAYIIETIKNALICISEKRTYGVSTLAYLLHGYDEKEYRSFDIKNNKYFGTLSEISIEHLYNLIYYLIGKGYIFQEKHYMPKIKVTIKFKNLNRIDNQMKQDIKDILSRENQKLL